MYLLRYLTVSNLAKISNIKMTIKEKEKLRTVRDHILIGESGPIVFKN